MLLQAGVSSVSAKSLVEARRMLSCSARWASRRGRVSILLLLVFRGVVLGSGRVGGTAGLTVELSG